MNKINSECQAGNVINNRIAKFESREQDKGADRKDNSRRSKHIRKQIFWIMITKPKSYMINNWSYCD